MIGKGHAISQTKDSISYGWNQEKDAEVVFRQHLMGENPTEIAREFRFIQSQNHYCKNNTLSFILSPTIEDGKKLNLRDLQEICLKFTSQMKLINRQAIGFVHRDKEHLHIHLYVNRIDFNGNVYDDSFLDPRSMRTAVQVAQQMNLTTVKDVVLEKLGRLSPVRSKIRSIHDHVINRYRPKNFDQYIRHMKAKGVEVIPSITKDGNLRGFRLAYGNHNLKASEIHRSMGGGNLAIELYGRSIIRSNNIIPVKIEGTLVPIAPKLAHRIATRIASKIIKQTKGIGIEI